jgi:pimeloyl-ACP methyl ester carboxylesterase
MPTDPTDGDTEMADRNSAPLMIEEQGSFAVGGVVLSTPGAFDYRKPAPAGQTFHCDHAYVTYQKPVDARKYPLVMLHGHLQFSKTWESTPDGREGFNNIFLRRRYSVYLIDQPRRGNAGRSAVPMTLEPATEDQQWFNIFRVGNWPDYFPGVQFPRDPESLNQYFRQSTPNTGPFDLHVVSDAVAALFDKVGPAVLVSHSQGGGVGWAAACKTENIKGIVSYEPGSNFPFPEEEVPGAMNSSAGPLEPLPVPNAQFLKLTRMPIIIYYGDYIPAEWNDNPGQDQWRVRVDMAHLWAETVNRHGGDVTVVELPKIGVKGNTHFPFSDLNNVEIADLMSQFLAEKGLD